MNASKFLTLALLLALPVGRPATAAQSYAYQLIPGQNKASYTINVGQTPRRVFVGLSGRVEFDLNDDLSIVGRVFDLTLEGPFDYGVHGPFDWAPFAPGDKLADYLAADFSTASGSSTMVTGTDGVTTGPFFASVYPVLDDGSSSNGNSYMIDSLAVKEAGLYFFADARAEIGGAFRLWPPIDFVHADPGDPTAGFDSLVSANVQRIPEPAAAAMLAAGLCCLRRRRR